MKIDNILNKYITPRTTGYTALAGIALTAVSGYSRNKVIRKAHKPLAFFTMLASFIHIGQIEYSHYKWKHKK